MAGDKPLVSIGVLSYNNASYIIDTLNSISNQDHPALELIVIDDCSTDNSRELIRDWLPGNNVRVKKLFNETNSGVPKNCNRILKSLDPSSKYLCIIGSDDLFTPGRIAKQVVLLEDTPANIAATFGDADIIDSNGKKTLDSYFAMQGRNFQYYEDLLGKDKLLVLQELINHNSIPAATLMYKTAVIREMGGWDETVFIEDLAMNLNLVNKGYSFFPVKEIMARHRKHSSSVTTGMKAGYLDSLLTIVSRYGGMSKGIDASIGKNMNEYAFALYQRNGKNAVKFLKERYRHNRGFRNFLLYRLASMGIPYKMIKPFYSAFKKDKTQVS